MSLSRWETAQSQTLRLSSLLRGILTHACAASSESFTSSMAFCFNHTCYCHLFTLTLLDGYLASHHIIVLTLQWTGVFQLLYSTNAIMLFCTKTAEHARCLYCSSLSIFKSVWYILTPAKNLTVHRQMCLLVGNIWMLHKSAKKQLRRCQVNVLSLLLHFSFPTYPTVPVFNLSTV